MPFRQIENCIEGIPLTFTIEKTKICNLFRQNHFNLQILL